MSFTPGSCWRGTPGDSTFSRCAPGTLAGGRLFGWCVLVRASRWSATVTGSSTWWAHPKFRAAQDNYTGKSRLVIVLFPRLRRHGEFQDTAGRWVSAVMAEGIRRLCVAVTG